MAKAKAAQDARKIEVDFTVCPAQSKAWRLLQNPRTRIANAWGRGTGKSHFARESMYLDVAKWEGKQRATVAGHCSGVRQVLLMPTLKQFKKVHAQAVEAELAPSGKWGFLNADINRTDWRITFPGGSWIQVVTAQNISGALGIRCDKVVADECDDIEISDYETVCIPWFSEPWSLDVRMLGGTPRRGRFGLLWRAYNVWPNGDANHQALPNAYGIHATYRDAPRIISAEMVADAKRTMSPDRFAREWECDFDSGEGLVYPFFDTHFHVRHPVNQTLFHTYLVGFDYGFSDPSAFIVIGVAGSGRDVVCHVVHERVVVGKSDSELAEIAKSIEFLYPNAYWYSDHHPSTIAAFRDVARVRVREAFKGPDSVENGVAFVADALFIREDDDGKQWAQLYVSPECRNLIQEFGLYRRKRDHRDKERILDTIDTSANDHCCDALRYALTTHFHALDGRKGLIL